MLIELRAGSHTFAAENGVLSAHDAQVLHDIASLESKMARERLALLDEARSQAQAHLDEANREAEEMIAFARAEADPEAITAAAQAKAHQMLERARKDAQRLRRQAREEGRQEGMATVAAQWHEQHMALCAERQRSLDALSDKMVGIVISAVERIVEVEPREALFQRATRGVQHLIRGAMGLKLKVNADDVQPARNAMEALQTLGLRVEVAADATLLPGACIFESELGLLDASLGLQLDSLRLAMRKALAQTVDAPPPPAQETSHAHA